MTWDKRPGGVNCADVERAILTRMLEGGWLPDHRLPTCTALATELGANKNTVSKAYQSLARRGYLRSERGRGTFVVRRPRTDRGRVLEHLQHLITLSLQEAKLAGLDQDRFLTLVQETAARYYRRRQLRLGFVECIPHDATALSRDLQEALGYPVTPLLLEEVLADPGGRLSSYDLVGVAITHLAEVEEAAGTQGPELVEVFVAPDPASLAQVIRLRPGARVGIFCDARETLASLNRIVSAYKPDLKVSGCLVSRAQRTRRLLDSVDVALVTISAQPSLERLDPRVPLVPVSFHLEPLSVERFRARLDEHLAAEPFPAAR
ncbi:MAG TPA: GntR family transcriptional regulator [Candidatus Dormibacteraeota bacterium]|nr:GntR family transcriptional regulator [Candidatus Dormibacteraeota bacterium]